MAMILIIQCKLSEVLIFKLRQDACMHYKSLMTLITPNHIQPCTPTEDWSFCSVIDYLAAYCWSERV